MKSPINKTLSLIFLSFLIVSYAIASSSHDNSLNKKQAISQNASSKLVCVIQEEDSLPAGTPAPDGCVFGKVLDSSLNNNGQVAFVAEVVKPDESGYPCASQNATVMAKMLFLASPVEETFDIQHIFGNVYLNASNPSINDDGFVAFSVPASPNQTCQGGIYLYKEGEVESVVLIGHHICDAFTVKELGPPTMDNNEAIAFWALSEEGSKGIFLFIPGEDIIQVSIANNGINTFSTGNSADQSSLLDIGQRISMPLMKIADDGNSLLFTVTITGSAQCLYKADVEGSLIYTCSLVSSGEIVTLRDGNKARLHGFSIGERSLSSNGELCFYSSMDRSVSKKGEQYGIFHIGSSGAISARALRGDMIERSNFIWTFQIPTIGEPELIIPPCMPATNKKGEIVFHGLDTEVMGNIYLTNALGTSSIVKCRPLLEDEEVLESLSSFAPEINENRQIAFGTATGGKEGLYILSLSGRPILPIPKIGFYGENIEHMIRCVELLPLSEGLKNSLNTKLKGALKFTNDLRSGKMDRALMSLRRTKNHIERMSLPNRIKRRMISKINKAIRRMGLMIQQKRVAASKVIINKINAFNNELRALEKSHILGDTCKFLSLSSNCLIFDLRGIPPVHGGVEEQPFHSFPTAPRPSQIVYISSGEYLFHYALLMYADQIFPDEVMIIDDMGNPVKSFRTSGFGLIDIWDITYIPNTERFALIGIHDGRYENNDYIYIVNDDGILEEMYPLVSDIYFGMTYIPTGIYAGGYALAIREQCNTHVLILNIYGQIMSEITLPFHPAWTEIGYSVPVHTRSLDFMPATANSPDVILICRSPLQCVEADVFAVDLDGNYQWYFDYLDPYREGMGSSPWGLTYNSAMDLLALVVWDYDEPEEVIHMLDTSGTVHDRFTINIGFGCHLPKGVAYNPSNKTVAVIEGMYTPYQFHLNWYEDVFFCDKSGNLINAVETEAEYLNREICHIPLLNWWAILGDVALTGGPPWWKHNIWIANEDASVCGYSDMPRSPLVDDTLASFGCKSPMGICFSLDHGGFIVVGAHEDDTHRMYFLDPQGDLMYSFVLDIENGGVPYGVTMINDEEIAVLTRDPTWLWNGYDPWLRAIFVFRIPQLPEIPEPEIVRCYRWWDNIILLIHIGFGGTYTRGIAYDPETSSFILVSYPQARVFFVKESLLTSSYPWTDW